MDVLEESCLHPEIEEISTKHLTIRIECPGSTDATFTISLDQWTFDEEEFDVVQAEGEREIVQEKT